MRGLSPDGGCLHLLHLLHRRACCACRACCPCCTCCGCTCCTFHTAVKVVALQLAISRPMWFLALFVKPLRCISILAECTSRPIVLLLLVITCRKLWLAGAQVYNGSVQSFAVNTHGDTVAGELQDHLRAVICDPRYSWEARPVPVAVLRLAERPQSRAFLSSIWPFSPATLTPCCPPLSSGAGPHTSSLVLCS